jgi:hypothetical protein
VTANQNLWSRENERSRVMRVVEVEIALGGTLSDIAEAMLAKLVGIELPAIDSAAITFLGAAAPGGSFRSIYGPTGTELSVTASTGDRMVVPPDIGRWHSIKLRSGVVATPVTQAALRTIRLIFHDGS